LRSSPERSSISSLETSPQVTKGAALARRQIVAKGPIPKILKLLPAVEPMYQMYPNILHEIGRDDLIIK